MPSFTSKILFCPLNDLLDDGKYFTFSNNSISGNAGFKNAQLTSLEIKFAKHAKFEPKAKYAKGVSKLYVGITPSSANQCGSS